jgi:hypothetical protein
MIGLILILLTHLFTALCFYFLGLDAGKKYERIRSAMRSIKNQKS